MILKQLRLSRHISQEQLAQMSGLNVRTIQRIERGQTPGLETMKSLAAVFDVELSALQHEEQTMSPENLQTLRQNMTEDEKDALEYVRDLKGFYSNLASYVIFIIFLLGVNLMTSPGYLWVIWPALGWGIGVAIHGLNVFELSNFFGSDWERRQVEKRLGRKL